MIHPVWARFGACASSAVLWFCFVGQAAAGPKEVFGAVEVASSNPDLLTVRWINGEGGIFLSRDRGKSFKITCFGAIESSLQGKGAYALKTATDGSMCVGTGSGVRCSDAQGCAWQEAAELKGKWIADFAEDPVDKDVMYVVTGDTEAKNGVWKRAGTSGPWAPFGAPVDAWFSRLHVVKNGAGKRFWASAIENVEVAGADGGVSQTAVKYYLRYSDDDAASWTSHYWGEIKDRAQLRLVAVDPTSADRIIVLIQRTLEGEPDDLYYSDKRGEPGSFVKIGSVTEFGGVAFMPDGALYYGDNDQNSPALYKVSKLGDAPTKLSDAYKVGCLGYDVASQRLYMCADWRFGTADPESGAFTSMFVINTADPFLECPGEPAMKEQCGPAFRTPNFCDITHWPEAPVCVRDFGTAGFAGAGGSAGAAGGGGAGTAGSAGSAGAKAGSGAGSGAAGMDEGDSGCGCRTRGGGAGGGWIFALGLGFWAWFRARRPRA
ncbi:MAG TPA: hypothetical protein VJV78_36660 [Polyangiales bacterium]|nr:hypothetical protein [Polyangiales bacterium]